MLDLKGISIYEEHYTGLISCLVSIILQIKKKYQCSNFTIKAMKSMTNLEPCDLCNRALMDSLNFLI